MVNRQIMEARNEALAPAQPTLGFASKAEPLPGNCSSYVSVLNGAGIVGMKLNPAQWLNAVLTAAVACTGKPWTGRSLRPPQAVCCSPIYRVVFSSTT